MGNTETDDIREELFQQATEDVSGYRWALSEWFDHSGEYSDLYLLLEIFTRLCRAERILKGLDKDASTDEHEIVRKLSNLKSRKENEFKEFLDDSKRVEAIFKDSIPEIIEFLRSKLKEVENLSDDSFLYEDESLINEDLPEAGKEFLQLFTQLFYVNEFHETLGNYASAFFTEFDKLEADFKQKFHYFVPLTSQLKYESEMFCPGQSEWWYTTEPDRFRRQLMEYVEGCLEIEDAIKLEEHLESCEDCNREINHIKDFNKFLSNERSLCDDQCVNVGVLSPEVLGKYVLDEASMKKDEREMVENHLSLCNHCLNDVICMRAAAVDIPVDHVFKPLPESIKDKLKYHYCKEETTDVSPEVVVRLNDYFNKVGNKLSDLIAAFVSPGSFVPAISMGGNDDKKQVSNEEVATIYKIVRFPDYENKITLLNDPNKSDSADELKPLSERINHKRFFYSLFYLYFDDCNEEIKKIEAIVICDSKRSIPLKVKRPEDTNHLLVCIWDKKEELKSKTDALLDLLLSKSTDKVENKIDNLICLLVEVNENNEQ